MIFMWFWIVIAWLTMLFSTVDHIETWYMFLYLKIKYPYIHVSELNVIAKDILTDRTGITFLFYHAAKNILIMCTAIICIQVSEWFGLALAIWYGGVALVIFTNLHSLDLAWQEIEDREERRMKHCIGKALKNAIKKEEYHGKSD